MGNPCATFGRRYFCGLVQMLDANPNWSAQATHEESSSESNGLFRIEQVPNNWKFCFQNSELKPRAHRSSFELCLLPVNETGDLYRGSKFKNSWKN